MKLKHRLRKLFGFCVCDSKEYSFHIYPVIGLICRCRWCGGRK